MKTSLKSTFSIISPLIKSNSQLIRKQNQKSHIKSKCHLKSTKIKAIQNINTENKVKFRKFNHSLNHFKEQSK